MKNILTPIALSVILFTASCGSPDQTNVVEETHEETLEEIGNLKLKAAAIMEALGNPDSKVWNDVNASDLKHHNPWMEEGLDGLKSTIADRQYFVARLFQDGNYVFAQAEERRGEQMYVRMDVLRFSQGQFVELWTGIAPQLDDSKASGRKQMGGKQISSEHSKTAANKALISEYVISVMVGRKYENIPNFFNGDTLIQHNPLIEDGLETWQAAIHEQKANGMAIEYNENVHVLGEGNFVLALCNGTLGGESARFFNLFRLHNDKIAEHWDVTHLVNEKLQ